MIDWDDEPPPIELLHAEAERIALVVQIREWQDALDIMRWRLAPSPSPPKPKQPVRRRSTGATT